MQIERLNKKEAIMIKTLLIAYDRNTAGLYGYYDCIYDEFSNRADLMEEWLSYNGYSYGGPWKIVIKDVVLFYKFKQDFLKICESGYISELKSFKDIWIIAYLRNPEECFIIENPCEEALNILENEMKNDLREKKIINENHTKETDSKE